VHRVGGGTLKLRSAYGKGIRPPRLGYRGTLPEGLVATERVLVPWDLRPETQAGVETGADYALGTSRTGVALHVTRFDQRASGLIQSVALGTYGAPAARRVTYVLQNVGEITNRGWELQTTAQAGRLGLAGTLSLVDSRVARTTASYTGDLRNGDRMLDVPARTASLAATWSAPRWATTWTLARASDWVGYDRLAMARDLSALGGTSASSLSGTRLRDYWRAYDGVTHLRATFTRELPHGLALLFTGDNLLDQQRGDPDDVTVVPGRTVTVGVRARF
jgi:iron complex outermembrane receptor protein